MSGYTRRPEWLKLSAFDPAALIEMRKLIRGLRLHTVCESARCPNRPDCFTRGTATFMILGDTCTRSCTFCAVKHGKPRVPDPEEPEHIAAAVKRLGLQYAVITSVTRDDLADGGASHFAGTIKAIHSYDRRILVEVLVPDFQGSLSALRTVIDAAPTVLNHNIETVPRLYDEVRPEADYQRSLALLQRAKHLRNSLLTKSGLMLGLGETEGEVMSVMADLRQVGCDLLTLGQYLQPSLRHHQVARYVSPKEFKRYENIGQEMGFSSVFAGPLVRSSFHAAEMQVSSQKRQ